MEASMKVELKVDQQTTAADLVDQLMKARLANIRDELDKWNESPEVAAACQTLLDWMATPGE
jgi:uncharacterized protein (DUF924 family)